MGYNKVVELKPRQRMNYEMEDGGCPFEEWLDALKDVKARAIIRVRLDRLSVGHFGEHHSVGEGVWELVIDYGPGYRVYYGECKGYVVLILLGGTKRRQDGDIKIAQKYFADFRRRNA
jgi:putative addiction module killer protein